MTFTLDINSIFFALLLIGIAVAVYRSYRDLFRIFVLTALVIVALVSGPQLANIRPHRWIDYVSIPVIAWGLLVAQGRILIGILKSSVGGSISVSNKADRLFKISFSLLAVTLLAIINPLGRIMDKTQFYAGFDVGWMRTAAVYSPDFLGLNGLWSVVVYLLCALGSAYLAVQALRNGTSYSKPARALRVFAISTSVILLLVFLLGLIFRNANFNAIG